MKMLRLDKIRFLAGESRMWLALNNLLHTILFAAETNNFNLNALFAYDVH